MDRLENFVMHGANTYSTTSPLTSPRPPVPQGFPSNIQMMGMGVGEFVQNGSIHIPFPLSQGMVPNYGLPGMHGVSPSQGSFSTSAYETTPRHEATGQNSTGSIEVDSPTKDEGKEKKKKRKGGPNKKWKPFHDDVLIPYLVDLASKGMKCHKTFKPQAFVAAAKHINQHFNEDFTAKHVENHMRTLKDKWKIICHCKNLSGAGWDDSTKTILLDEKTLKADIEKHPNHAPYLTKPIENYEELKIICGEDIATGEFRKTSYDSEEEKEPEPINLEDDDGDTSKVFSISSLHASQNVTGNTSHPSRKRKRDEIQVICVQELTGGLKDIADAINASRQGKWLEKLSEIVWGMKGFSQRDLNLVFNELYKNELDAKAFIVKPKKVQNDEVVDILRKHGRLPASGSGGYEGNINDVCGDDSFFAETL